MAKSGWRGLGGASDGRIDLAPRRQRRLERKRANDKRHLNHPKLGRTWSTSSLQSCLPSTSKKYLQPSSSSSSSSSSSINKTVT